MATILETAKVHQEEDVIWVSNDRDFWDDTDTGFHEHLVEDVASMEASGRVRPVKELWDVVLELAAQHSSDAGDMEALRNELQEQTVLKYLEKFLSDNAEQFHLDAREAALPVETEDAAIRSIHDLEDLIYEVKGGVASGEAVAGFTIKGQVDMTLRLPIEATGTYSPDEIVSTSDDSATILTRKPLIFRGVLQLGRYDGPLGVEITGIDAEPNDPGFALWRLMERQQYRHLAIMKRIFENPSMTRNFVPSAEAVRKMAEELAVGSQSVAIRKIFENPSVIRDLASQAEAMRKMAEPWNVAKTFEWVQKNLWDPDRSPRGVQGFRDDTPVEVTTEADEADNDVGNNDEK